MELEGEVEAAERARAGHDDVVTTLGAQLKAGSDEGLLELSLPVLIYMENTYRENTQQ